jgi:gamma-glutamyl-gamma-aminobutyrate hydrolase PuuD
VIEAIESRRNQFAVGLQCHPEGMWRTTAPEFAGVFAAFVEAARARSRAMAN